MDVKTKTQWTVEETTCLLRFWSSSEVQNKLEGATRTKAIFESGDVCRRLQRRHDVALAGSMAGSGRCETNWFITGITSFELALAPARNWLSVLFGVKAASEGWLASPLGIG